MVSLLLFNCFIPGYQLRQRKLMCAMALARCSVGAKRKPALDAQARQSKSVLRVQGDGAVEVADGLRLPAGTQIQRSTTHQSKAIVPVESQRLVEVCQSLRAITKL